MFDYCTLVLESSSKLQKDIDGTQTKLCNNTERDKEETDRNRNAATPQTSAGGFVQAISHVGEDYDVPRLI